MSSKGVPEECPTRVSIKSILQECLTRVSSKSVVQECHLTVSSQGVPQVGLLEIVTNKYSIILNLCFSTYVSAFGFVGFILFFLYYGLITPPQEELKWSPWDIWGSVWIGPQVMSWHWRMTPVRTALGFSWGWNQPSWGSLAIAQSATGRPVRYYTAPLFTYVDMILF